MLRKKTTLTTYVKTQNICQHADKKNADYLQEKNVGTF